MERKVECVHYLHAFFVRLYSENIEKTVWQLEQSKGREKERREERILNYEYKSLLFLETQQ